MHDLADHIVHDLVIGIQEVIAAHAGLARHSSGDDDDVRIGCVRVVVGAEDRRVALLNRHGLQQVETFSLGNSFDDVDQDDIGQLFRGDPMSGSGADVSRSYYRYFIAHESFLS